MTNEKTEALDRFYESVLIAAQRGEHVFAYGDADESEVVKRLNKIVNEVRENHRDSISVKLDQVGNKITFTKKTDAKAEVEDTPVIPKAEEVEVVEPKKWPTPAVDMTLENPKWVEDCETPEDCEDGCKGDCKEGFEGENLT